MDKISIPDGYKIYKATISIDYIALAKDVEEVADFLSEAVGNESWFSSDPEIEEWDGCYPDAWTDNSYIYHNLEGINNIKLGELPNEKGDALKARIQKGIDEWLK